MALRLPLTGALDVTITDLGGASVAGGYAHTFKLPQDTDNVVVKMLASVTSGGMSAIFQTSDDGGNTYFDVARTSIVSHNGVGAQPQWLSIPVVSGGINPLVASNANVGSIAGGSVGNAAASTLGSRQVSGLPVLGLQNRVFAILTGTATANSTRIQVLVNNQSATA